MTCILVCIIAFRCFLVCFPVMINVWFYIAPFRCISLVIPLIGYALSRPYLGFFTPLKQPRKNWCGNQRLSRSC